jgi:thiamine-phosphate pyrophosphorylase
MPIAFKLPVFYPIVDTAALARKECSPIQAAEGLLEAGVRILQFRHKDAWTQGHFETALQIANLCHAAGVLFVLNDRADYARMLGAALHIGQHDLPPVAARQVISDEVMGYSTHNRVQLTRGNEEPVEYVSLGPIFGTDSKAQPDPQVGVDGLRELRKLTEKPLVAIGGITLLNAKKVLEAGADSVAVIGGFLPDKCNRKTMRRAGEEWLQVLALPVVG